MYNLAVADTSDSQRREEARPGKKYAESGDESDQAVVHALNALKNLCALLIGLKDSSARRTLLLYIDEAHELDALGGVTVSAVNSVMADLLSKAEGMKLAAPHVLVLTSTTSQVSLLAPNPKMPASQTGLPSARWLETVTDGLLQPWSLFPSNLYLRQHIDSLRRSHTFTPRSVQTLEFAMLVGRPLYVSC